MNLTVLNSTKDDPGAITFLNWEKVKANSIQVFAMSDIHIGIFEFKIALFFDHPQFFSRNKNFLEGFPDEILKFNVTGQPTADLQYPPYFEKVESVYKIPKGQKEIFIGECKDINGDEIEVQMKHKNPLRLSLIQRDDCNISLKIEGYEKSNFEKFEIAITLSDQKDKSEYDLTLQVVCPRNDIECIKA